LSSPKVARERIGKGHHFSGKYSTLADRILALVKTAQPVT
jgi:type IV secretory pathway VirJ component